MARSPVTGQQHPSDNPDRNVPSLPTGNETLSPSASLLHFATCSLTSLCHSRRWFRTWPPAGDAVPASPALFGVAILPSGLLVSGDGQAADTFGGQPTAPPHASSTHRVRLAAPFPSVGVVTHEDLLASVLSSHIVQAIVQRQPTDRVDTTRQLILGQGCCTRVQFQCSSSQARLYGRPEKARVG